MRFSNAGAAVRVARRYLFIVLFFVSVAMFFDTPLVLKPESPFSSAVRANSVYFDLGAGDLSFNITPATTNLITVNDNWSGVGSVEGYFGQDLTTTHGVDPQTVLGTEFPSNQLPSTPTNVAANKGNPSAFNAGGVAEFDTGTYLAVGLQGNVQANPYLVFYVSTLGRGGITISYDIQDIDAGNNNSVSPVALQYRIGETGLFTNLPGGYIADVTTGGVATPAQSRSVTLPAAADNQSQVQIRIITTNAANGSGNSTPDEWIGVNNVLITSLGPSAANASASGRVVTADGNGVRGAYVRMWDSMGNSRLTQTGAFGYFSFDDVEVGGTYFFEVSSKRYTFVNPIIVRTINDNVSDIDFVADGPGSTTLLSLPRSVRDGQVSRSTSQALSAN